MIMQWTIWHAITSVQKPKSCPTGIRCSFKYNLRNITSKNLPGKSLFAQMQNKIIHRVLHANDHHRCLTVGSPCRTHWPGRRRRRAVEVVAAATGDGGSLTSVTVSAGPSCLSMWSPCSCLFNSATVCCTASFSRPRGATGGGKKATVIPRALMLLHATNL
jgi:hypothetical protein